MKKIISSEIGKKFKEVLATELFPIGFHFTDKKPANTIGFKKSGAGCMMPLVYSAARGKTVAFDENSVGWSCSPFYLGYTEWIRKGIEYYLSHGPIGSNCERFVKTPKLAKEHVESMRLPERSKGVAVFKPLEQFIVNETPELVTFFANPNQLSALTFLLYYDAPPNEERVVTRFTSACGAVASLPLQIARSGEYKAVWGGHDLSARARLPKDLMTMTFPYSVIENMYTNIDESFLRTELWAKLTRK